MIRALWRWNQAWRCDAAAGLRFFLREADLCQDAIGLSGGGRAGARRGSCSKWYSFALLATSSAWPGEQRLE